MLVREKFIHEFYRSNGKSYGKSTYIYSLKVGTKFNLQNGYWSGEIVEFQGEKHILYIPQTESYITLEEYV